MSWVDINDTATDPDAPLTSELGKAWSGNVIEAFEGGAGAVRKKWQIESYYSGGNVTYAIPDNYTGAKMSFGLNAGAVDHTISIQLSSNGVTFSDAYVLATNPSGGNDVIGGFAFIDFVSGRIVSRYGTNFGADGVLDGAGDTVTHYRISVGGGGSDSSSYIIEYNGGEV